MNNAAQKCAGGQDNSACRNGFALSGDYALDHPIGDDQIFYRGGFDGQVGIVKERVLHGVPVEFPVCLGAWASNCGAFPAVEHAELDAGGVGNFAHNAIERVDFPDQMAFAEAADGGVARHFADGFQLVGDEKGRGAEARGSGGCFAASVASSDHDHIIHFGVLWNRRVIYAGRRWGARDGVGGPHVSRETYI